VGFSIAVAGTLAEGLLSTELSGVGEVAKTAALVFAAFGVKNASFIVQLSQAISKEVKTIIQSLTGASSKPQLPHH
jgi:hypothetical protein